MSRNLKTIILVVLLALGGVFFYKYDVATKFGKFVTIMGNIITNMQKDPHDYYFSGIDLNVSDEEIREINITKIAKEFEAGQRTKIESLIKRIKELELKLAQKKKLDQERAKIIAEEEARAIEAQTIEEKKLKHSKIEAKLVKRVRLEDLPEKFRPLKKYLHEPFRMGACLICHDGDTAMPGKLVTKKNIVALCYKCHPRKDIRNYDHKPVEKGKCFKCHDPHQSNTEKLLKAKSINALCLKCHNVTRKDTSIKKVINMNKAFKHKPVEKNCLNCHEHHSSKYRKLLKSEDGNLQLCMKCHNKNKMDKKWINYKNVKYQHGAIVHKGKKCLECHDPHSSKYKNILKKDHISVCLNCHNKSLKSDEDEEPMMNMAKHLKTHKHWHKPIKEHEKRGGCAACHNPHGSNHFSILKESYTKKFYGNFSKKGFICFKCHKVEKIKKQFTTKTTNFRDGKVNLHFLHINERKGRTCRACHDEHASKYPKLIRDYTVFGGVKFPLRYIETKNGGSCQPACHKKFSYDRVSPVGIGKRK